MEQGRLQLRNEAVPVEYEIRTERVHNKRETTGRLILTQPPGDQLATALKNMTGANLILENGQTLWVEFTGNSNGEEIEFIASPPQGFVVN
jgi:hypothetical protein